MPDFDIDFCMDERDQVINYVAETYGRDAVSQIITFGTMAAKAVVRDVTRIQDKPFMLGDKLSKMIPMDVGITLQKAYDQEETLREHLANDADANEVWEMSLTIIDWAVKMVNVKRAKLDEEPVNIDLIDLADQATFKYLQTAETTAVFQLESRGMKDLVKRLRPDDIEDMTALVALFRPGPLQSGMVDDFINRKHGRAEVAYPDAKYQHEKLKPILEFSKVVRQSRALTQPLPLKFST